MPVKTKRDEHKWEKAKEIAEEAGKKDNFAYIMGIYKRMNPDYEFKTGPEAKGAAMDGFDFFDQPEDRPEPPPEEQARQDFVRQVGSMPTVLDASRLFRDRKLVSLVQSAVFYIPPHKAWFVYSGLSAPQAQRFGKRLFRGLIGRRNLTASLPALHQVPLWVGTSEGKAVRVDPPAKKARKQDTQMPFMAWAKSIGWEPSKALAAHVLSDLLAILRAQRQMYLTCHWQAMGTSFYGDHLLFQRLYESLDDQIDGLAEKIVALFGKSAVDAPHQAERQAMLLSVWEDEWHDPFRRAYHTEVAFQTQLATVIQTLKTLKQHGSLGLEAFLSELANQHETNQYLLGQRIGAMLREAAGMKSYTVYLFSETGKTLFKKDFKARDDNDADTRALRLVKPELNKHDDAEDWVVELKGGSKKGAEAASYPDNLGAVEMVQFYQLATEAQQKLMDRLVDASKVKQAWQLLQKVLGVKLHPFRAASRGNQNIIESPMSFHPVKVEPPRAKRKAFPFTGFIDFQGLKIDVENKAGSTRSGEGPEGKWETYMHSHYGEIRGTEGTDGDKLDVYVGENHDSPIVVVIHQHNPWDGKYDEDKVMVGFDSVEEAIGAYKKQYDRPGFYRDDEYLAMPIGAFWRWVMDKRKKGKKITALYDDVKRNSAQRVASLWLERQGMDHPSEKARKKYLEEHPNADPKNHRVEESGDKKEEKGEKGKSPVSPKVKDKVLSTLNDILDMGSNWGNPRFVDHGPTKDALKQLQYHRNSGHFKEIQKALEEGKETPPEALESVIQALENLAKSEKPSERIESRDDYVALYKPLKKTLSQWKGKGVSTKVKKMFKKKAARQHSAQKVAKIWVSRRLR